MTTRLAAPGRTGRNWRSVVLVVAAGFVLLSAVRAITDAQALTDDGTLRDALRLGVPIGLAALGGLWAERAGVINIGLEGMMIFGTWFGAWAGYQYGPWTGVVVGLVGGAVGGLVHAVATVGFGVDHIVSGVAINILALGLTGFLAKEFFDGVEGGTERQSPPVDQITTISFPADWLQSLQDREWFLVSDLAGLLAGVLVDLSLLTLVAVALVPLTYLVLWRTGFGLRLRSCGENPAAAESLGVNVYLMKYLAVMISGACAGLAGAYLVTVASNVYLEGQTGGRGYIGLAAMIFGNWRPGALAAGTVLFGYSDALRLRSADESVPALLLFVAVGLAALLVREVVRRAQRAGGLHLLLPLAPLAWLCAVAALVGGIAFGVAIDGWTGFGTGVLAVAACVGLAMLGTLLARRHGTETFTGLLVATVVLAVWYLSGVGVPEQFVRVTPYIVTLLVLAFASQRLRPPAADGVRYRRGQA